MWHSWGRLRERLPHVADPRGFMPPEDPEAARDALERLQACVDPVSLGLVLASCLAAVLTRGQGPSEAKDPALFRHLANAMPGFSTRDRARLLQAPWTLVPILVDARGKRDTVWFAGGLLEGDETLLTPCWWPSVADGQAQNGAAVAGTLVQARIRRGLVILPVVSPWGPQCVFGPSLALPLYLAAVGLARGRRPEHLAATGALEESGAVGAVSAVMKKARAARVLGRRALICPDQGVELERKGSAPLTLLPVKDLEAAEYLWETYEDQSGRNALADFQRLSHPEELAHTLHLVDARARGWHGFQPRYREAVEKIAREPALTMQALERLAKIVRDPQADPAWIQRLLEPWDASCFQSVAEKNALAAFQLAQIRWAAATRRGDPGEAAQWAQCCEALQDRLLQYPDGIYKVCDFLNRRLVSERQALYRFDPYLPQDVQDMVRSLEEERRLRARDGRKPAAPALGKLYGTIAQNYGFCGPAYLDEVRRVVSAAQDAFGLGELPEYRADWRRQFHYRLYAELDAEAWEAAQFTLQAYLGSSGPAQRRGEPWAVPPERWSPFEHAAMARFGAETGAVDPAYDAWARDRLKRPFSGHPWPLWLWNMGRIFSTKEEKRSAWWKSAELSLMLGPTAQPMALLPLAWLHREGLATAAELEPHVERVVNLLTRGPLWRPHFESLLACPTAIGLLEETIRRASALFPFTYR
ncbi:MAG: hypothetical protein WHS86_15155 [Desulfosoma sp.]